MLRSGIPIAALLVAASCRPAATPGPTADTPRPVDTPRFRFSARAVVAPSSAGDSLITIVTVRNRADSTVHVGFGACPVEPQLLRAEGTVAWTMPPHPCPLYLRLDSLRAGAEMSPDEFTVAVPVAEILDDSLPTGDYRVRAHVRLDRDTATVDAGTVRLKR